MIVFPLRRSVGFLGQRALHRGHEPRVHAHEFQTRPRPFSGVRGRGSWVVSAFMGCAVDLQHEHGCLSVAAADRKQPADLDSAGRLRAPMGACRSRTNADDRLPLASLGRVQGGDGIVEGRDVADVRPQSSVTHPLDDLTQLGTIGLDNEVDRQAVGGPRLGRPDDGHQCSSGSNQACGPLLDVAADDIEHQIDAADVFQRVVVEVDELLRAEVERLLTVGRASGAR